MYDNNIKKEGGSEAIYNVCISLSLSQYKSEVDSNKICIINPRKSQLK